MPWFLILMVATFHPYHVRLDAVQYTGANAADIMDLADTFIDPMFPVDEASLDGDTITCYFGVLNPGDWVVRNWRNDFNPAPVTVASDALMTGGTLDSEHEVAAPVLAMGIASVPTLAGSTQTTVQVTISPGFADTSYQATALVSGALNLLGSLSVLSVTVFSATRVDVVVRNTGILSLGGASVLVTAIHN